MVFDASALTRQKTLLDYQQLQEEFELKKALTQSELAKASYLDVDKFGEQSIFKAAQGIPLSPEEEAAARVVSAKSGGIQFDPTTGNMFQKPNLGSQLGLDLGGSLPAHQPGGFGMQPNASTAAPVPFALDPNNEFDTQFKQTYEGLASNPKAQQQITTDYFKSKNQMTDAESKAAGFADRMIANEPILAKTEVINALANPLQKGLGSLGAVGNYFTSDEYQSGNQAQRDFINAVLRRESGAVISTEEFANARQQYFPQPGDAPGTLAQKAANRQTALGGIQRSAGPAYKKPASKTEKPQGNANRAQQFTQQQLEAEAARRRSGQ